MLSVLHKLHAFLAQAGFPARWDRVGGARPAVESLGLLGLALMALSLGLGNTGQSIGMGLLFIASLCAWRHLWSGLKEDWVARAVVAGFCLVLLRTLWAALEMPGLAAEHWDRARVISRVLAFPLACWWLGGSLRSVKSVCILVLAGAVINIVYYGNWARVDSLALTQRLWFGGDPRMEGLLHASILAGMIAFARSWWGHPASRLAFFARVMLWLALYLLMVWALIAVQARAAWIATALTGLLFFGWFVWNTLRSRGGRRPRFEFALACVLLAGTGIMLAAFANTIGHRLLEDHGEFAISIDGEVTHVEDLSVATRIYLAQAGWHGWLRKPLFGWGPGSGRYYIAHADIPAGFRGFSDFHNNYLDMLMRFGVVGMILFGAFWGVLITRFVVGLRAGKMPASLGGFGISICLIFFVVNFTDTYIDFQFGWYYMLLLCALLHSPLMRLHRDGDSAPTRQNSASPA
ncbi:MAG: O-antigen ligase family protein [Gammaproteobacteria bacterium]